jgi:hypothetical protein
VRGYSKPKEGLAGQSGEREFRIFPASLVDVSGAGVPARDAAGGGKGRPATLDQDVDAGFAGRRAGTPAPLLNFPFTRLP